MSDDVTDMDVVRVDLPSQARMGLRSNAVGLPLSNLTYSNQADAEVFGDRVLERHAAIINRPLSLYADSRTDPRWLPVLAALEIGDSMDIRRTGLGDVDLVFRCVVVSMEHTLTATPAAWRATIGLSTIEQTL